MVAVEQFRAVVDAPPSVPTSRPSSQTSFHQPSEAVGVVVYIHLDVIPSLQADVFDYR
ncbi:hypothetical protein PM082_019358 [Marasmius tenuissimus]|nr:hypothetical protein PM082_019358 [Marasmius tenuissimus]